MINEKNAPQPEQSNGEDAIIAAAMAELERRGKTERGELPQEEKEFDKDAYAAKKKAERDELYDMLDNATIEVAGNLDSLKSYLVTAANFETTSTANTLLIFAQNPKATDLRSYDDWGKVGRHAKKGATSIKLFGAGKEYEREDGSVGKSYNEVRNYFDLKQTSGTAITTHKSDDSIDYQNCVMKLITLLPQKIVPQKELASDAMYMEEDDSIYVKPGITPPLMLRGILREAAFARLANVSGEDRLGAEFAAHTAAYLLCTKYHIATSDIELPIDRLAGFEEPKDIRAELNSARETAANISRLVNRALGRDGKGRQQSEAR